MRRKKDLYIDYRKNRRKKSIWRRSILLITLISAVMSLSALIIVMAFNIFAKQSDDFTAYVEDNTDSIVNQTDNMSDMTENNSSETQPDSDSQSNNLTQTEAEDKAVAAMPDITIPVEEDITVSNLPDADTQGREAVKVKGIYIKAPSAGSERIDKLIELIDKTELNAVVIDVKDDSGNITYAMESQTAAEIGAISKAIPDIGSLLAKLKEHNIYTIARIVAFKDPLLAEKRQELAVKNSDGSLYRDNNKEGWVNPYNRKVWDYLAEVATQAAMDGFDEIQFDYIRFSTGAGMTKADFGEEAKTVSKTEIITEFTRFIYEEIKPLGVFISADVYGTIINSNVDAVIVGQDYAQMARYLDYICPMVYPSHFAEGNYGIKNPDREPYNIIKKAMEASNAALAQIPEDEHRAVVRPWLQAFTASWVKNYIKYGGKEIREQIDGVYSAGYDEWLLWNAAASYSEAGLLQE